MIVWSHPQMNPDSTSEETSCHVVSLCTFSPPPPLRLSDSLTLPRSLLSPLRFGFVTQFYVCRPCVFSRSLLGAALVLCRVMWLHEGRGSVQSSCLLNATLLTTWWGCKGPRAGSAAGSEEFRSTMWCV